MRRRDFIGLVGAVTTLPLAALAQERRLRRVALLLPATAGDAEYAVLVAAFIQALRELGWSDGGNVQIEIRWAGANADSNRRHASELAALAPDVIFSSGAASTGPLLQATRAIPVVFAIVPDPVGAGFVDSLARPGGNATGFTSFEFGIGGKWLELLREITPRVRRVAVLRDSTITAGIGQWSAIQTAAPTFGMEASPINLRDAREVEQAITSFAGTPDGGLIVTSSGLAIAHRATIIAQAAKHRLPAIYYSRPFIADGGLISYGSDRTDQFRRAAAYANRILRGEKPGDLPVQAPTKYELVINLKAARALGITVPPTLLARADEVIE